MESKRCPKCKIHNPVTAIRCDCGYDFEAGLIKESYLLAKSERRLLMHVVLSLRAANAVFWLWMLFSAAMLPVVGGKDFWAAKSAQLFALNPHLSDLPRFLGNALIPLLLWFMFDLAFRQGRRLG